MFFNSFSQFSQELPLQKYDWAKEIESKQMKFKESQTLCNINDQLNHQLRFWAQFNQQKYHSNQPDPEKFQQYLTTPRNRCCVSHFHRSILDRVCWRSYEPTNELPRK